MLLISKTEGSLYVDVTPDLLGFKKKTTQMGMPIVYPEKIWKKLTAVFVTSAQSNCPVDTGYLRDNIGGAFDGGGAELWSDAPYSVYQEYGTYKMAAQPYFESAVALAVAAVEPELVDTQDFFDRMDRDFAIMESGLYTLEDYYWAADRLNYYQAEMIERGISIGAILVYKEHINNRIQRLEEMQEGIDLAMGNPLVEMIIAVLVTSLISLLMDLIFFPIDQFISDNRTKTEHHPIRKGDTQ